jgi:hypothetical protein
MDHLLPKKKFKTHIRLSVQKETQNICISMRVKKQNTVRVPQQGKKYLDFFSCARAGALRVPNSNARQMHNNTADTSVPLIFGKKLYKKNHFFFCFFLKCFISSQNLHRIPF